ncbi:MAG: putative porin, partial [Burkholderiales bacterium]
LLQLFDYHFYCQQLQYHLYQQYKISDRLQAYHEIKLLNQFNQFKAPQLSNLSHRYLGNPTTQPKSLEETTILQTVGNELALKGDIGRFFYRCYYLHKKLDWQPADRKSSQSFKEHYFGLQTRIQLNDSANCLHMHGEYLRDGHYQWHTTYEGPLIEWGYHQMRYKPSFLVQHYQGHYRKWDKHFESPKNYQLYGAIRVNLPHLMLKPHVRITKVERPIYFQNLPTTTPASQPNKDYIPQAPPLVIEPRQGQGHVNLFYLGMDVNLTIFSHFHADNELIFTKKQGPCAGIFRTPQWLINSRLYYARSLYDGRLDIETGIDLHWHSPYMADGYDPATQQFHIQNEYKVYSYLLVDLFFNFRIKTFRGFIKLNYLNQHLKFMKGLPGYFSTPLYPGQSRSLDVGVSWSFFD